MQFLFKKNSSLFFIGKKTNKNFQAISYTKKSLKKILHDFSWKKNSNENFQANFYTKKNSKKNFLGDLPLKNLKVMF